MATTEKEFIDLMQTELIALEDINENLKALKDEAKEAGFDGTMLVTVAKALVKDKLTELQEKSQSVVDLLQKL